MSFIGIKLCLYDFQYIYVLHAFDLENNKNEIMHRVRLFHRSFKLL
jgi:hypothetical protein